MDGKVDKAINKIGNDKRISKEEREVIDIWKELKKLRSKIPNINYEIKLESGKTLDVRPYLSIVCSTASKEGISEIMSMIIEKTGIDYVINREYEEMFSGYVLDKLVSCPINLEFLEYRFINYIAIKIGGKPEEQIISGAYFAVRAEIIDDIYRRYSTVSSAVVPYVIIEWWICNELMNKDNDAKGLKEIKFEDYFKNKVIEHEKYLKYFDEETSVPELNTSSIDLSSQEEKYEYIKNNTEDIWNTVRCDTIEDNGGELENEKYPEYFKDVQIDKTTRSIIMNLAQSYRASRLNRMGDRVQELLVNNYFNKKTILEERKKREIEKIRTEKSMQELKSLKQERKDLGREINKANKEIKRKDKDYERLHKENELLKEKLNRLKDKNVEEEIKSKEQKIKKIDMEIRLVQEKLKGQDKIIANLKDREDKHKRKIKELEELNLELLNSMEEQINESYNQFNTDIPLEIVLDSLRNERIVIIGGQDMDIEFRSLGLNRTKIIGAEETINNKDISNYDYVVFLVHSLKHTNYYKVKRFFKNHGKKIMHFNGSNVEALLRYIHQEINVNDVKKARA